MSVLFLVLLGFSGFAFAANPADAQNVMTMMTSLLGVVIVILLLAWLVKKLNPQLGASEHFKVVRSMPLGTKERLMIIELDDKQHLLGVTPNSINYLYQLEKPLPQAEMPMMAKGISELLKTSKKNE
ncbi:flagellar biosynthetic protein FliO [Pseudoalteromonas xiamenensis]|uniref:Flagellar protein n=1 Tax=Pseudoalteromonas xiamenensis TaxID=882626 RepID=A0A975DG63_9GAMM|nr:flagellar biosynthetic protein FliO [Pseudoalteromonas xiamenensis]QTH71070.1 flagellar biosynthetic protein FliO [Pseudoalteromonas xiamenensis]